MTQDIDKTLEERGNRYGEFKDNAALSQQLKRVMEKNHVTKWVTLSAIHREALEVIAAKIARILNGDPDYPDNWHDIAGYAKLAEKACKSEYLDIPAFLRTPRDPGVDLSKDSIILDVLHDSLISKNNIHIAIDRDQGTVNHTGRVREISDATIRFTSVAGVDHGFCIDDIVSATTCNKSQ